MNRIQFERRKRKKGYLIPLVIILLLYFMIPVFLNNKGSSLVEKSFSKIGKNGVFSPSVEFYNGIAFLNTAAAFPGFGKWSENVQSDALERMIVLQEVQFKILCKELTKKSIQSDSVQIIESAQTNKTIISLKTFNADSSTIVDIQLNDSLLNYIDSAYCIPWSQFFIKTKTDKSRLFDFCKKLN